MENENKGLPPISIDPNTFLKEQFVLPTLPSTLMQILQVVHSDMGGAAQVTELIGRDASMVSHLLRVVNSAYYALPKQIANLQNAVAYIGLGEVSRICLTLSVINTLKPKDKKELQHFWLHSYLCALIAKRLVREYRNVGEIGDLYAAALLHDIGKLVYTRFFPAHYAEMRKYCTTYGRFLVDAEQHYSMPSHMTFGALLCDHWNLGLLEESLRRERPEGVHLTGALRGQALAEAYASSDVLHAESEAKSIVATLPAGLAVECPSNTYMHRAEVARDIEEFFAGLG